MTELLPAPRPTIDITSPPPQQPGGGESHDRDPTLEYARNVGCPYCKNQWTRAQQAAIDLGSVTIHRDFLRYVTWWDCPEGEFHRCTDPQAAEHGLQPPPAAA